MNSEKREMPQKQWELPSEHSAPEISMQEWDSTSKKELENILSEEIENLSRNVDEANKCLENLRHWREAAEEVVKEMEQQEVTNKAVRIANECMKELDEYVSYNRRFLRIVMITQSINIVLILIKLIFF